MSKRRSLGFAPGEHRSRASGRAKRAAEAVREARAALKGARCSGAITELGIANFELGALQAHLEAGTEGRFNIPLNRRYNSLSNSIYQLREQLIAKCSRY